MSEHGGINTYGYVNENPISRIDPKGLDSLGNFGSWSQDQYPGSGSTGNMPAPNASAAVGKWWAGNSEEEKCVLVCDVSLSSPCKPTFHPFSSWQGAALTLACDGVAHEACVLACKPKVCKAFGESIENDNVPGP